MMGRWIVSNLGLMVLAVLLAMAVWVVSSLQDDPIIEAGVTFQVQAIGEERLHDFSVQTNFPQTVLTHVRGPRSSLAQLQATTPQITLDLVDLGPGQHTVKLTPKLAGVPGTIISTEAATATVSIERIVSIPMTIRVSTVGQPAVGFRTGLARVDPETVTVIGPQSILTRVANVNVVVPVDGARATLQFVSQRLVATDARGEPVREVRFDPETVSVRVVQEQLSNYRDLPVVVKWRGQPAEGYAVADISVEPLIITVFGSTDTVQGTKGFIETLDVVINNAQADIDERVGLNVPPGVSLVGESTNVRVRIKVRPLVGSRTVKRKPVLLGLSSTLTSTVQPATVDIVLSGPLPRLNNLTEDDVRATVDVVGLDEGTFQLTPRIIAPDGITVNSLLPATLQVDLAKPKRRP